MTDATDTPQPPSSVPPAAAPLPAGRPRHPLWRRPGGIALLLLALLVLAFAACEMAGWPFLRQPIERTLEKRLQREVVIGEDFRLSLLGGIRLRSDRFVIGAPSWAIERGHPEELVRADQVVLALPYATVLMPLRQEPGAALHIKALEVQRMQAALWRGADGRANWQFAPPEQAPKPGAAPVPTFDRLVVGGGEVRYQDEVVGLQMQARARTDEGSQGGGKGLVIEGDGAYREGVKRFAGAKFHFGIQSEGLLPLVTPNENAPPVPLTLDASAGKAKLAFKGQAVDILRLQGISGEFSVSGPSLAAVGAPMGVTLPTTPEFEMKGRLSKDGDLYKADVARLAVGSSRLAGEFSYDRRPEVPLLTGELRGESLTLADLGPAFGAREPGAAKPKRADGQVLPAREFNIPSLKAMNADVKVNLRKLELGTGLLGDLTPLQGRIALRDGVLHITELLARASGGEVRGSIGLDGRPAQQPLWDIDLRWAGIDLERWIKARNNRAAADTAAAAPGYVGGVLGGQAKFRGAGRSTAAMLGSLDGTAAVWIRRGKISHLIVEALGIDVAQALGVLIKGDESLPMHCAVAQFKAQDGRLNTEVGVIDTPDTLVLISGDLSLADERLGLTLAARPKDFSPLSLRSPVRVEGSFRDPQVKLEGKALGLKLLAAAALAAVNPLAAVVPLIDPGEGEENGCRQALEGLRGKPATRAVRESAREGAQR
ncbi:AsmA family protein [Aquabacterium sp. A7-Y]|uniref:AsmA family protein n=1 Tax=Aquabacterium sp. A7-Y TaxID=1349605 RepID=UPI00223E2D09|nr:AsmA family protein [Aquabacterium sp. A7-Y]MCW7537841.1 AsmA family protein [Aquabacterium sp. A7-Y]